MTRSDGDAATEAAPANFDIFVLGTRSSGKSLLLASLYRQLSSMDGVTNFFARCDDPNQHKELCNNYDQLLDTEADWPAGTFRVDSYDMCCFHRLRGKSLPVFSIRFHDYPGGYVSNQVERRDFIEERAASCNSVMALIDGRKLLDRLEDREDNPAHSLHKDLDSLVRVLQQCVGKPIHFVLTKADLLAPAKYPLKDIIAELKRHKGFGDILVQQIEAEATCYLIPVSAIGPNFAAIDPSDGVIKKRRNGTIEPFHLDVMTSVSMVDTVLDLARNAVSPSAPPVEPTGRIAAFFKGRLGKNLRYARVLAPMAVPVFGGLGVTGILALSTAAENHIADKSRSFEDKARVIRQGITDQASALEAILKIQYQLLDRFLKRFPAARLAARFDPATLLAPFVLDARKPSPSSASVKAGVTPTEATPITKSEAPSGPSQLEMASDVDEDLPHLLRRKFRTLLLVGLAAAGALTIFNLYPHSNGKNHNSSDVSTAGTQAAEAVATDAERDRTASGAATDVPTIKPTPTATAAIAIGPPATPTNASPNSNSFKRCNSGNVTFEGSVIDAASANMLDDMIFMPSDCSGRFQVVGRQTDVSAAAKSLAQKQARSVVGYLESRGVEEGHIMVSTRISQLEGVEVNVAK